MATKNERINDTKYDELVERVRQLTRKQISGQRFVNCAKDLLANGIIHTVVRNSRNIITDLLAKKINITPEQYEDYILICDELLIDAGFVSKWRWKDYFFKALKDTNIKDKTTEGVFRSIGAESNLTRDEIKKLLVVNPTVIFSYFPGLDSLANYSSPVVPLHISSEEINTRYSYKKNRNVTKEKGNDGVSDFKLDTIQGIYTCHTLTPYKDTILLLLDLGRVSRLAVTCGLSDRLKMIVANPEWAMLNKSTHYIQSNYGVNVSDAYQDNFGFRMKIYKKIFLPENILAFSPDDIVSKHQFLKNEDRFNEISDAYDNYGADIESAYYEVTNKKKEENLDKRFLLNFIDSLISKSIPLAKLHNTRLRHLSYPFVSDAENLTILRIIIAYFGNYKANTFKYVILQYLAQYDLDEHLKVGPESEFDFDVVFNALYHNDYVEKKKDFKAYGLYYKQYFFLEKEVRSPGTGLTEKRKLTQIPYYFPSGDLAVEIKDQVERDENTILLGDSLEKVKKIIDKMDLEQIAIQSADLLCYLNAHYEKEHDFKDFVRIMSTSYENTDNYEFLEIDELLRCWKHYRSDPVSSSAQFSSKVFSMWHDRDEVVLPYYFIPYIILHKAIQEDEAAKKYEAGLRDFFTKIVEVALNEVRQLS